MNLKAVPFLFPPFFFARRPSCPGRFALIHAFEELTPDYLRPYFVTDVPVFPFASSLGVHADQSFPSLSSFGVSNACPRLFPYPLSYISHCLLIAQQDSDPSKLFLLNIESFDPVTQPLLEEKKSLRNCYLRRSVAFWFCNCSNFLISTFPLPLSRPSPFVLFFSTRTLDYRAAPFPN